jgi:hypothetical protein
MQKDLLVRDTACGIGVNHTQLYPDSDISMSRVLGLQEASSRISCSSAPGLEFFCQHENEDFHSVLAMSKGAAKMHSRSSW